MHLHFFIDTQIRPIGINKASDAVAGLSHRDCEYDFIFGLELQSFCDDCGFEHAAHDGSHADRGRIQASIRRHDGCVGMAVFCFVIGIAREFRESRCIDDISELHGSFFGKGLYGHFSAKIAAFDDFEGMFCREVFCAEIGIGEVQIDVLGIARSGVGAESVLFIRDAGGEVAEICNLLQIERMSVVLANGSTFGDGFAYFELIIECRSGELNFFCHGVLQKKGRARIAGGNSERDEGRIAAGNRPIQKSKN